MPNTNRTIRPPFLDEFMTSNHKITF